MTLCYVVQQQHMKIQTEFSWLLIFGSVGQMRQRKWTWEKETIWRTWTGWYNYLGWVGRESERHMIKFPAQLLQQR